MRALPVDYRRCREDACAEGPEEWRRRPRSNAGEPVVAFTHAVDCRPGAAAETEAAGADCSGERAGNLYLQYWFYYPGSATAEGSTPLKGPIRKASTAVGKPTYHPDDWESLQVKIEPGGRRSARASSHHGYVYDAGGPGLIPGHVSRPGRGGRMVIERRSRNPERLGPGHGLHLRRRRQSRRQGGRAAGQIAHDQLAAGAADPATRDRRDRQTPSSQSCLRGSRRSTSTPRARRPTEPFEYAAPTAVEVSNR